MKKPRLKHSLIVVTYGVVLYLVLTNLTGLVQVVTLLRHILMPFFFGLFVAYLLNIPYTAYRKHLFSRLGKKSIAVANISKHIALLLAYITVLLILAALIWIIIPQLVISLTLLVQNIPYYIRSTEQLITRIGSYFGQENFYEGQLDMVWPNLIAWSHSLLNNVIDNFINYFSSLTSRIFNYIIGIAFSVYLLSGKERLLGHARKLILAYSRKERAEHFFRICSQTNRIFTNFIAGNILDSMLVGFLCFLGMSLLGLPYPLLISVIIGVTNLIPIIGPFIGAVPGALIILTIEPLQAVFFAIFILVLQQLDGNVFKPRIFGNKIGLPSIWVLLSIVFLGGLLGIPGMLVGVPVFAVLYALLRESVETRLAAKKIAAEGPAEDVLPAEQEKEQADGQEKPDPIVPGTDAGDTETGDIIESEDS